MKKKLLSIFIIAAMICTAIPSVTFAKSTVITVHNSATIELDQPETTDTITWKTSNKKVATVKDGVVTGLKAGTCKITAKFGTEKKTYTIKVPSNYDGINVLDFGALYGKKNVFGPEEVQLAMKEFMDEMLKDQDISSFAGLLEPIMEVINVRGYNAKNVKQAKSLIKKYEKKLKNKKFKKSDGAWSKNDLVVATERDGKQVIVVYLDLKNVDFEKILAELEKLYPEIGNLIDVDDLSELF